jgi:bacillithiol biosynthesis cysteine-adding enzyme BshC
MVGATTSSPPSSPPCVVTGQQVGLLTGPLLTVLKAARAVSFAKEASAARGTPVVPLFWAASDDHDLDEIHSTHVLNAQDEAQKLRLDLGPARGAASEVAVPDGIGSALVRELFEVASIDPAAFPVEPWLPEAGDSLARWFCRSLQHAFGPHAPTIVEPSQLTAAARGIFDQALRDDGAVGRALAEGTAANQAAGLAAPLPVEDEPPLFLIEAGARTRVRRGARSGEFRVGERTFSRAALLDFATAGVPRLSANVALRTIVQAATLPVVAYVAGPTEFLYYRQLEPLHRLFGVAFPQLVRRPHATVMTTAAARAARKLGVAPTGLLAALDAREQAAPARTPLLDRGAALRAEVAGYVEQLTAVSPAVKSAAERRATQLLQSFDGLLERAGAAIADGAKSDGARWSTLAATVRPRGRPQERVLNVLPFLAQRGPALIEQFLALRGEPDGDGVVPHAVIGAE